MTSKTGCKSWAIPTTSSTRTGSCRKSAKPAIYTYSAVGELQNITTAEGQTTYQYDGTARRVAWADEAGSTEYLYGNPDEDYEITAVRRPGGQIDEGGTRGDVCMFSRRQSCQGKKQKPCS